MEQQSLKLNPIGIFRCQKHQPSTAGRQGSVDLCTEPGVIELSEGLNFEQALIGLKEFSHLWVIYCFHHNPNWKPMVRPPRGREEKVGVFATRSPYRPNPIGISAVRLKSILGRKIFVEGFDLLDETPILDIKPYLTYADSFPEANQGWLKLNPYKINFSASALIQLSLLYEIGVTELRNVIHQQLEHSPFDSSKKRVHQQNESWIFAFRTWRVEFGELKAGELSIMRIYSGYSQAELGLAEDPYQDKAQHRHFLGRFWPFELPTN